MWFWSRPLPKTMAKLLDSKVEFVVLSELVLEDPAWAEKKLDKLKTIFQS